MKLTLTSPEGIVLREWGREEIVDLDMRPADRDKLAADIAMEICEYKPVAVGSQA